MHRSVISPENLRFGVYEVDLRAAELRKHGVRIKLQEQPFQILAILLEHPGDLVTREELRERLWPAHTFVDFDRSLNKSMTKLRSALGDSAENPRYIETLHRRGYRFLAPINVHHDDADGSSASNSLPSEEPDSPHHNADHQAVLPTRVDHAPPAIPAVNRQRVYTFAATAAVLIVAATFSYLRVYRPVVLGNSWIPVNPRRSVAVLGFKNLSADPKESWLSTAFSDWLTTELSAGDQLRTIPAESVTRMKIELALPELDSLGRDNLTRIRKNLGTDLVVLGSYATLDQPQGRQIRLDLRLLDARTGETIDAISETGTDAALFDLVSRAGEDLRSKLGVRVTREEAGEAATAMPSNEEGARFYSEGLDKLRVFDALAAQSLLSKAVAAEPSYSLAHAALATAWAQLGYDEKARAEAKRAFDLSANLPRAERLLVEGRYRQASLDWQRAIDIYHALFEFYPDNLDYGLGLANAQVSAGKGKDALITVGELRELPPPLRDDPRIDLAEGTAAESLGDFKRVEASTGRAIERAEAIGASLLVARAKLDQAWAFENLGRFKEVEGGVEQAKQLYLGGHDPKGVAAATTVGAIALEDEGDYVGAKRGYEESLEIFRELGCKLEVGNEYDNIADILLYLGDLPGARKTYEESLATHREIGHMDGVALAQNGLGDVLLTLGKHSEAKQMYEEALEICNQIGDRSKAATALSGLGRVLRLEGDLEAARKSEMESRAIFEEIGDKSGVTQSHLRLAELSLDEGKNAEAADSARDAAGVFEEMKAGRDEAAANLVLSRTLFAEGKIVEARQHVDRAMALASESHSRELEMFSAVTSAMVHAASGNPRDTDEATKTLNAILAEANSRGFANVALDARLALGEIEMSSGDPAGRPRLESLQRDAANGGFSLIARKAAAVLRTGRSQAALLIGN